MWERIYQAGKDEQYKFQHYGINSIVKLLAGPDLMIRLPEMAEPIKHCGHWAIQYM
jgi:hypothetical protein